MNFACTFAHVQAQRIQQGRPLSGQVSHCCSVLSFSAGLCVALTQCQHSRKASSRREYNSDVASRAFVRTTRNGSPAAGAPIQGINQGCNRIGADPQVAYVLPLGLAIGKYVHNFLQCGLQQGYAFAANRLAQQRSLLRTTVPNAVRLSVPLASAAAERAGF